MKPALTGIRLPGSGRARFAILLVDASQALQEGARETACLKIRQQLEVVLHLLCFHLFNEVDGASTCDLSLSCLRRIQFAPESPDFIIFALKNLVKMASAAVSLSKTVMARMLNAFLIDPIVRRRQSYGRLYAGMGHLQRGDVKEVLNTL